MDGDRVSADQRHPIIYRAQRLPNDLREVVVGDPVCATT
jgi:hypothetical protein